MTAPRKLVIWDNGWAPYASEFASRLGSGWRVVAGPGELDWLQVEIPDATAVLAIQMPPEALPWARNLQVFLFPGAGLLQTDADALPAGCPVVNVYEHETPIAEYVLMMMLAHVTGLRPHLESFRAGRWDGSGRVGGKPHRELFGRTVGLFGYGRIGQAIAARARAFGMRVAAALGPDPMAKGTVPPDFAAPNDHIDELLGQSDFLVIAAPLTGATVGRIGAREIALLPSDAFLINVSRAEIVQEEPLYDALAAGRIAGAALDVWYQYPVPGTLGHGSRLPFHDLPNVFCTPHYSAWSQAMILRRIDRMTETLHRLLRGDKLERVALVGAWKP